MSGNDTMVEAIALSSPSGRMSKRSRETAERRLHDELFGAEGLKGPKAVQPSERERKLAWAKELRALAARGMSPRKFTRQAERLEREAKGGAV